MMGNNPLIAIGLFCLMAIAVLASVWVWEKVKGWKDGD